MMLDMTGKNSWMVRRRAAMLSYVYDDVSVAKEEGKTIIVCQGTRKLAEGRAG